MGMKQGFAAFALGLTALLSGCGGDDEEKKSEATCDFDAQTGCKDGLVCERVGTERSSEPRKEAFILGLVRRVYHRTDGRTQGGCLSKDPYGIFILRLEMFCLRQFFQAPGDSAHVADLPAKGKAFSQ